MKHDTTTDDDNKKHSFFTKNAVIPQPSLDHVVRVDTSLILVNSSDRNYKEYPSPSSYIIHFPYEFRDIISIELLNYDVPIHESLVSKYNNRIHYGFQFPQLQINDHHQLVIDYRKEAMSFIELSPGNYNMNSMEYDELGTVLETLLNALQLSIFKVFFYPDTQKYSITTDFSNQSDPDNDLCFFQLFFQGNKNQFLPQSIGKLLGFPKQDVDTLLEGTIYTQETSPFILYGKYTHWGEKNHVRKGDWLFVQEINDSTKRYRAQVVDILSSNEMKIDRSLTLQNAIAWVGRFDGTWIRDLNYNPYLLLKVNDYEVVTNTNNTVGPCFSVIPIRKFNFENRDSLQSIKVFQNILPRLSKLEIAFYDHNGELHDFQGLDHVLIFRVEFYQQNMSYVQMPFSSSNIMKF